MTPAIGPQPEEASGSPSDKSAAHPAAQIGAGLAGSVAVTLAARNLGGSPWATLAIALVGATVPVLIGYKPQHRHLRLGLVLIVVAAAFALTYGGFTLYDAAADKKTFPSPIKDPTPTATASPTPDGGGPRAQVSPPELRCTPDECGQVHIASVGDEAVRVDGIAFQDDQANGFAPNGDCVGDTIDPDDSCTFDVDYNPESGAGTQTATLLVATSDGSTAPVELEGSSAPTVNFGFGTVPGPTCAPVPEEPSKLTIAFSLTGPQDGSVLVGTDVSDPAPRNVGDVSFDLDFGEATPPGEIKITIDPNNDVIETSDGENDNEHTVGCG